MDEVNNKLLAFAEKHQLKKAALHACSVAITNCLADDPENLGGFQHKDIRLEFVQHQFIFGHYRLRTPLIKTRIGLYRAEENDLYVRKLEPIDYYELDTDTQGEQVDDWLVVDEKK